MRRNRLEEKFLSSQPMCVCACACVCLQTSECVRVCAPLCPCVPSACEGPRAGLPLFSVRFSLHVGQASALLASSFALSVPPSLRLTPRTRTRRPGPGTSRVNVYSRTLFSRLGLTVCISGEIICVPTFSSFLLRTNARELLPEYCTIFPLGVQS